MIEMRTDGHFTLIQNGRLGIPASIEKKWGIYIDYKLGYQKIKQILSSWPETKRKFPFLSASRIVVLFPMDATAEEVLRALEYIVEDLKQQIKTSEELENPKEE